MTSRIVAFESVLIAFALFTGYAIASQGYGGFIALAVSLSESVWGIQLLLDFVLAIGMLLYWMSSNARERGIAFWPFALLTLTLGSIGPLCYFAWREWKVWLASRSSRDGSVGVDPSHQRA
jgi:hypothetical protein